MAQKKNMRDVIGVNDTKFLLLGIPILSFLIPLLFFGKSLNNGSVPYIFTWGVSFMYTFSYWISTRYIICQMRIRFPEQQETKKRILYTAFFTVISFTVLSVSLDFLHEDLMGMYDADGPTDFDYNVASFTILLLCWAIYESIFLYANWKASIVMTEKLKREHIESQLDGLKSQVSPHFLFNSLNTLAYLIPEDADRAVKFVQKLSKVYRYILEIRDKKLICLHEEMDFLKAYVFLLKERFGQNLVIKINVPEYLSDHKIVPLSLQILFENAIKHNIISERKPLLVEVYEEAGEKLVIKNNLQLKRQTTPSTKVGLGNIKNRYAFFSDRKVEILQEEEAFIVKLPLLLTHAEVQVEAG